jgi:hypothetical protein
MSFKVTSQCRACGEPKHVQGELRYGISLNVGNHGISQIYRRRRIDPISTCGLQQDVVVISSWTRAFISHRFQCREPKLLSGYGQPRAMTSSTWLASTIHEAVLDPASWPNKVPQTYGGQPSILRKGYVIAIKGTGTASTMLKHVLGNEFSMKSLLHS